MAETVDNQLQLLAMKAAADLSAAQFHLVRVSDNAGQVNIGSLATHSSLIGILWNAPNATGRGASVAYDGLAKVTLGAAVNSLTWFTTNGSGRAVAAASGDMCAGRLLETGGADGEIVSCLLYKPFRLSGAI